MIWVHALPETSPAYVITGKGEPAAEDRLSDSLVSVLKTSVDELRQNGSKWEFKVGGKYVQEATIVASLYCKLLERGVSDRTIRVDSRGHDLGVYDTAGKLRLVVEFKRLTRGKAFRDYVQGGTLHPGKGFLKDIGKLLKEQAAEKAFVVFDPEGLLARNTWKRSNVTWKDKLEEECKKADIPMFVIP